MSNIEDWRTAVDERTGRTYWYHRKTRESTWTRPKCFDTLDREGEMICDEQGYATLLLMLEGLGTPDVLVELLHDDSPELQSEAVQLFLSCCVPSTVYFLAREEGSISGLLNIIILSSTDTTTRCYALRCLCSMALNENALDFFSSHQGWVAAVTALPTWPDIESGILYTLLICILLREDSCACIIPEELINTCSHWLKRHQGPPIQLSVLHSHPSSEGVSLLSGGVLTMLAGASNIPGRDMPGTLLVTLARECLRWDCPASSTLYISILPYTYHT